jgi:hypothetical protein
MGEWKRVERRTVEEQGKELRSEIERRPPQDIFRTERPGSQRRERERAWK